MTKSPDTDERNLDDMLEGLAKPKPLEHKEKGESSQGRDAVEYQAAPHVPVARAEHNTFPNAPVIVNQTNPLQVTPEERKRLEAELERRRKAKERDERNAQTAPRRTDPPGVTSDPPGIPKKSVAKPLGALLLVAMVVAVVAIAMRSKTNESSAASASTSSTTAASVTTAATPTGRPTATATATHVMPEPHPTAPVRTASPSPTITQSSVVHSPPPTVTTSEPTASVTAPPGFKPGN